MLNTWVSGYIQLSQCGICGFVQSVLIAKRHVHVCVQEAKHWEAAFQVYEKGTSLFKYPHVADIWAAYLKSFVARWAAWCVCAHLLLHADAVLSTQHILRLNVHM